MDLMTVFTGLVILLRSGSGNAIATECYSCDVTGSDQECTDASVIQTCDEGDYGGCQTMVRAVKDQETGMVVTAIKKGCKSLTVCMSEVQTYSSSCKGPTTDGSICYYCCDSDLCNNEDVLVDLFPRSTTSSSSGPLPPTDGIPVDGAGISNSPRSMSTVSSTTKSVGNSTSPGTPDKAIPTWTVILIVVLVLLVSAFCLICLCCLIHRRKRKRASDETSNDTKVQALGDKKPEGSSLAHENYGSVYHEIYTEQMDSKPKPTTEPSNTGPLVPEGQNTSSLPKESTVSRVSNELYKRSSGNGVTERNNSFTPVPEHKAELTYENGTNVSEPTEYLTPI